MEVNVPHKSCCPVPQAERARLLLGLCSVSRKAQHSTWWKRRRGSGVEQGPSWSRPPAKGKGGPGEEQGVQMLMPGGQCVQLRNGRGAEGARTALTSSVCCGPACCHLVRVPQARFMQRWCLLGESCLESPGPGPGAGAEAALAACCLLTFLGTRRPPR